MGWPDAHGSARAWALVILVRDMCKKLKPRVRRKAAQSEWDIDPALFLTVLIWAGRQTWGSYHRELISHAAAHVPNCFILPDWGCLSGAFKPLFPVLAGLYIARACKRNLLQINHNEHDIHCGGNKRHSCTIIRLKLSWLRPLEANFFASQSWRNFFKKLV